MLIAAVVVGWWCWFGPSDPAYREKPDSLVSQPIGAGSGLTRRTSANIRQFVTNPLEPTSFPGEGTVILRDTGTDYYRNEQQSH